MEKRMSRGRQKVEMVKMSNESNLQVTFSKRRSGLFKKASELCTLCGADIAIVVFSPGRKVFSFGHPCVEAVVERFLMRNPTQSSSSSSSTMQLLEAHRNASVRDLNLQLTQVTSQLEAEKRRGEELNRIKKAGMAQCWWEGPIEEMDMTQLHHLKASLEDLKKSVTKQADRVLIHNSNSAAPPLFNNIPFNPPTPILNLNPFDVKNVLMPPPHLHHAYNLGYGHGFF